MKALVVAAAVLSVACAVSAFDYKKGCHDAASCREYIGQLQAFVETTLGKDEVDPTYLAEVLSGFVGSRPTDKSGDWLSSELSDVDKHW